MLDNELKILKSVTFCHPGSCCPKFNLTMDGWLIILDDFGGSIKIKADKELLMKTIKDLFSDQ
jgi:hypothetical protein